MFKLIGVTGKAGAGKTTFSDMLAEKDNIGVIHIDEFLKQMKMKYFNLLMEKDKDGKKTKVNSKLKILLYENKVLFNLFMKFRAKLTDKYVEEQIERLQNEGKDVVIIDDTFIKYQKRYKDLSKIYIIQRPYTERKLSMRERDDLTLEEMVAVDVAHFKGNYREILEERNVKKIINDKSKEELSNIANQIYEQNFMPFRDKYRGEITFDNRERKVNRNLEKGKDERE